MTIGRWVRRGVLGGALWAMACSGSPTPVTSPTETPPNPQLDALFSRLPAPQLQGTQPPRLVLRDGPAVPDANEVPLAIAITQQTQAPVAGPAGPLKVLSFSPTGDDDLTGAIRITFDQPMVSVAQLRELNPQGPAIEITPAVEGKVRWLGTTTWALEPKAGRLPLATDYTVRVPAGTRSAIGGTLEKAHEFVIRTPAPHLVSYSPADGETGVELQPWISVMFDQRVDPQAVLTALRVEGSAATRWLLVDADERAAKASEHPELGETTDRMVVLKPDRELPAGKDFRVTLPAGFVGAEGPKPTPHALSFTFRTIDPLEVSELRCGWGECVPGAPIWLETNNPLATTNEELATLLRVQPAPADLEPRVEGTRIQLNGTFAPRTTVRVQVATGLRDIHGQTLAKPFKGSVTVGDAPPQLSFDVQPLSTLELDGPRVLGVDAVNVPSIKTRVAKVERDKLMKVLSAMNQYQTWNRTGLDPFVVSDLSAVRRTVTSRAPRNSTTTLQVPIDPAVASGKPGYALVEVESGHEQIQARWLSLVQVTDLNALVLADAGGALVRVLSLSGGKPVADAKVELLGRGSLQVVSAGQTDASGMTRLAGVSEGQWLVRVSHGDDQVVLETWIGDRQSEWMGSITTDRDPYRPGDTVHMKLIARMRDNSAMAPTLLPPPGTHVSCTVQDAQYQERERFDGTLNAYGTLARDVTTEPGAALGAWHIHCQVGSEGGQLSGTFQVQEYRAPEIEVAVEAPAGTFFRGDTARFQVASSYLFGAPAAGLSLDYTVGATPEAYAPPGHPSYHFGDEPRFPWLRSSRVMALNESPRARTTMRGPSPIVAAPSLSSGHRVLGADGKATVEATLDSDDPEASGPLRVQLEAAVTDLSRQQVANRASVIAHPAAIYVGVRNQHPFVADDAPIVTSLLATDVAGGVVAGRALSTRLLCEVGAPIWHPLRGLRYDVEEKEVARCDETSAQEPTRCTFPAQPAGRYTIEVTAKDDRQRVARTRSSVWVYGSGIRPWFSDTPSIEISADKESYAVGETAKLLVRAPIASGRGVLTLQRRGIVESRPIDLDGSIQQIEVPITDAHVPNLTVHLSLARGRLSDADVGSLLRGLGAEARRAAAEDIGRPMHVAGSIELQVERDSKRLKLAVTPDRATARPGEELTVTVAVKTPDDRPADAEVTLMVVDEAVLSLLAYETPDPLPALLPPVYSMTSSEAVASKLIRRSALAAQPQARPAMAMRAASGGRSGPAMDTLLGGTLEAAPMMAEAKQQGAPTAARSLFATTAHYVASARTDNGQVRVKFKLPDNLTRFRLMALAVSRSDMAGSGQGEVTVRKPLLLRPALPRVASFGDRFEASVIVHNETGAERDVTVGIRAAGLSVEGDPIRRERLAAGEAREVAFPVTVVESNGQARVQFAAMTEGESDAVEHSLPLIAPATSEAFATYGSLTEDAVRYPLQVPADAIGRFGGLELSLSSTALTDLSDGVDYLVDYPYECAEQIGSRLIAAANLSVALVGRDDERAAALREVAMGALAKLKTLRRHDGSFGMWPGDNRDASLRMSTTAWVGFALHEASLAQLDVPRSMTEGAVSFLQQRLQYAGRIEHWNLWDRSLAAFVVSQLGGTPPTNAMEVLWQKRQELPLFAKAWLASTLRRSHPARSQELLLVIRNASVETAAGSHFAEHESEGQRFLWHSDHRTDAIVVHALLELAPTDPLIEKTVRGLMAARRNGRWRTTQENAWSLSALTRYFRAAEAEAPDMMARAWLGPVMLAETSLRGRTSSTQAALLPMSTLQELGSGDLTLGREGDGRLYYRVGLRYAPSTLLHDPEEQGFAVSRVFESTGDAQDVTRDAEGQWHIKAGANVRVRLTVVVPDTRYDVALDDPIAAGLEPVNMAFATTATQALADASREGQQWTPMWGFGCWIRWAFDHRELRDDRVTAFSDAVSAGVYELVYVARATTPGRFIAAPTKIEEMYAPETFARSGSDVVIVER